ncbi:MAG: ABC transporter ATP-binding protein [Acidobacteria bacterium]|nr:ABC transporter ATP-binding protein [Acidobacteriota bacterium]
MAAELVKDKNILIHTNLLAKSYQLGKNKVNIFENLSLEIKRGEMIAIVGPSGAGKSTLLHVLGGLDRPTSGSVIMDGFDICKLSDVDLARMRNKDIGFVFQFHHLLPEFSAVENTMMPLLISGKSQKTSRESAKNILTRVGLGQRLEHRPGELSGGEAARVALARALICEPKLLLADEPTGNLDSHTGEEIHKLLKLIHSECSLTSIIVTHNERLAAICSKVLHLEDGQLRT